MKLRWVLVAGVAVAVVLATTVLRDRLPNRGEFCTATVGPTTARVDLEQARWAALMAATAQNRGLPPRATTIAIATAFQESKLRNIDFGDRDSLGLFQQRPSQGWGTAEQVQDPAYAIGAFYDGLVEVEGYEEMEITDAAQEVQRSAFPQAYAQHETSSRALASALRGYSPEAFTCQVNPLGGGTVEAIVDDVDGAFGRIERREDADAVRYSVTGRDADDVRARGWALAHYLVANAARLEIVSIEFAGRRWSAVDSPDGWVEARSAADDVVTAAVV